jgi:hypothetical protein
MHIKEHNIIVLIKKNLEKLIMLNFFSFLCERDFKFINALLFPLPAHILNKSLQ